MTAMGGHPRTVHGRPFPDLIPVFQSIHGISQKLPLDRLEIMTCRGPDDIVAADKPVCHEGKND